MYNLGQRDIAPKCGYHDVVQAYENGFVCAAIWYKVFLIDKSTLFSNHALEIGFAATSIYDATTKDIKACVCHQNIK